MNQNNIPPPTEEDGLYERHQVNVDAGQSSLRVDKFLCTRLPHVSRHRLQQGIQHGFIKVNGTCIKASYKVRPFDQIKLYLPTPPPERHILAERMSLSIIYEDDALLVVHKPAGLVVHPAHGHWEGTLLNGLLYHLREAEHAYPYLVHRLDKDTSGLLVVAKTEHARYSLSRQFFLHTAGRSYQALVWGQPSPSKGTIDLPLQRSPKDRRIVCVSKVPEAGKRAITHYELCATYLHVSLLHCWLETGRTHQIRAHLQHIGHPLFNDSTYGGDKPKKGHLTAKYKQFLHNCWEILPHQALHAIRLGFEHPTTGKKVQFTSNTPPALQATIDKWARYEASHMRA